MIKKEELDNILVYYKAQPVGGYIDVIVKQENVRPLINKLILNGIHITQITWWECVEPDRMSRQYGMGGPASKYYGGWFSELCFGEDEISSNMTEAEINTIIENKEFNFKGARTISYRQDNWLTPALWLDVPEEWDSE